MRARIGARPGTSSGCRAAGMPPFKWQVRLSVFNVWVINDPERASPELLSRPELDDI